MKLSVFFIFLSLSLHLWSQTDLRTPYGFDRVFIEMREEALIKEMGAPQEIKSFEEEKKVWVDGGYSLEKAIVFLIGFDKVLLFDYQNKYCLWKAYIKDGRVVYMNLVSLYVQDQFVEQFSVAGKIKFKDRSDQVEQVLGKNFFPDHGFSYTDYLYHDLGIRFTFRQDRMTNVYLFRRLQNRADLLRLIRNYPKVD